MGSGGVYSLHSFTSEILALSSLRNHTWLIWFFTMLREISSNVRIQQTFSCCSFSARFSMFFLHHLLTYILLLIHSCFQFWWLKLASNNFRSSKLSLTHSFQVINIIFSQILYICVPRVQRFNGRANHQLRIWICSRLSLYFDQDKNQEQNKN